MTNINNNIHDNNIDLAMSIWRSDIGYRTINSFLINSSSKKDYIYHQDNNKIINYNDKNYNTKNVIDIIKNNMKDELKIKTYYRGASNKFKQSCIISSFISVSSDEEQARQFVDGECCLYKITVDPSVKRYKSGIEYETLLENGLYWEYIDKKGKYYNVNIKPLEQINLNTETKVEDKKYNSINNELIKSYFNLYKEEYLSFDDEPSYEGLIKYIQEENYSYYENNKSLIHDLAKEMIQEVAGIKAKKQKEKSKKAKRKKQKKC